MTRKVSNAKSKIVKAENNLKTKKKFFNAKILGQFYYSFKNDQ